MTPDTREGNGEADDEWYWEPRVVRKVDDSGVAGYSIREAYFAENGRLLGFTADALSPVEGSVAELRASIQKLLSENESEVSCGELNYSYEWKYVESWLQALDMPPVESTE